MVAIRGGYRMARGWHYSKLSLSSALLLSLSSMCFVLFFLSFCRFCLVFVLFCFHALVGALHMFLLSFPVQQTTSRIGNHVILCILLGTIEARSVHVKNATTTQQPTSSPLSNKADKSRSNQSSSISPTFSRPCHCRKTKYREVHGGGSGP